MSNESFVNIDLSGINESISDEKIRNDSSNESREHILGEINFESSKNDTNHKQQEEDCETIPPKNQYLDTISNKMMEDYSHYFDLKPTAQIKELDECIENLLTQMEEVCGLLETIRNDGNICLEQYSLVLLPKLSECEKMLSMVDKLERIVNHVSMQVSLMDGEVSRAEKMLGVKTSTMKKLFSFISLNDNDIGSSNSSSQRSYTYVPPDIFKTEELMKM